MSASVCCVPIEHKPLLVNLPSLPQSRTKEREHSETSSIVTLNTPTAGYITNEDTDYDNGDTSSSEPSDYTINTYKQHDYNDDESTSSSSSDWEPSTSMASTYLPREYKKMNNKSTLKPYISLRMDDDDCVSTFNRINTINHILFYPHSNFQSMLFSSSHCYQQTDYKKIKNVNIIDEDTSSINTSDMNWNDAVSVQKLKDLIHNLLVSASLTEGIREQVIYLMFSTPSPQSIIQQMRFGLLSDLCDVHMDRFGRRSFYRKDIDYHRKNKHSNDNHTYFYAHAHIPSKILATNDIQNLSQFVGDSPTLHSPRYLSPTLHSPERQRSKSSKTHVKYMSDDKLEWKNIDYKPDKPVTYLLTKKKNVAFNINPNRTATNIASKHSKKKTNHKVKVPLSALQEKNVHQNNKIMYTPTDSKQVHISHKKGAKMSMEQFKSIDLSDILVNNEIDNNYIIARKIVFYFDSKFDDTDTVCLVADNNKQPAISYWTKGQFVRKDKDVMGNKYILVYRAYKHIPAKEPIVSADEFEEYVKDLSFQYQNESVHYIAKKMNGKFGGGCHFVRSTQKKMKGNDFDVYCRYSNKYECSFKLEGITHHSYIIAWRR